MFGLGFFEIALIALLSLVFIGPERLPGLMKNLGSLYGSVKKQIQDFKNDLDNHKEL